MNSIPKVIHYCWFGEAPLPELAIKCIASWKQYCSGYEIREWNEKNFDLDACLYIKQAYQRKKWAFVSDYARFKILYEHGGLYFDTDVELIKPIGDIIDRGAFMGCENTDLKLGINDMQGFKVAPGLGLGALPGLNLYKEILDHYDTQSFIDEKGFENNETVVVKVTKILEKYGYKGNGEVERIAGITIYPPDYFGPKNYQTGEMILTENTRSIHHYVGSWLSPREQNWNAFVEKIREKYGVKNGNRILRLPPVRFYGCFRKKGLMGVFRRIWETIK